MRLILVFVTLSMTTACASESSRDGVIRTAHETEFTPHHGRPSTFRSGPETGGASSSSEQDDWISDLLGGILSSLFSSSPDTSDTFGD